MKKTFIYFLLLILSVLMISCNNNSRGKESKMTLFYLRSLTEKLVKNLDKESDVSYKRNQSNQNSELFVLDVDRRIIYVLIKPSGEATNYRVSFSTLTNIFPGYGSVSSDWFEFTSSWSYVDIKQRILRRLYEIRKEFGPTRGR